MILFKFSCYSPVHHFIIIFTGYITNQFHDQLPVGLLVQLVRALPWYRNGQGSYPGKQIQAFFLQLRMSRPSLR